PDAGVTPASWLSSSGEYRPLQSRSDAPTATPPPTLPPPAAAPTLGAPPAPSMMAAPLEPPLTMGAPSSPPPTIPNLPSREMPNEMPPGLPQASFNGVSTPYQPGPYPSTAQLGGPPGTV